MEYLPYVESLENGTPKFSCLFPRINKDGDDDEDDCIEIVDSSEHVNSIYSSSDDEIYGFDTPKKDKHNYIVNLMKKIEAETCEETFAEKDVIDGIEFLSFSSEQDLMDYAKTQQDLRTNASDDGLEILDDGTFSDISSNHAIVPTKTKDITRIKGWRNKHFAGINVCDDSGSSLRNDDDGFGDDFEMKSVQDESSEELESVGYAASNVSKSGLDGDQSHEKDFKRIDLPAIEDTNAVDNAEGFTFKKSIKNLSSSSISSCVSQKSLASNSSNVLEFSFDNFDIKGIFTSDKLSNISPIYEQLPSKKSTDSFLSPFTPFDKKSKHSYDSKPVVYKPRVKQGFLDRLARKVSADNFENVQEQSISSLLSTSRVEKGIRWCVPKEKLLSGNIYDVEVSMSSDSKLSNCEVIENNESQKNTLTSSPENCKARIVSSNVEVGDENIAAFRSTTLEHYTTNLDKLHIDFAIPKLDAADNVTHEDILLPVQDIITKLQQRQKPKSSPVEIRAKTVAEKRKLLEQNFINQRSKRKQKLSFKLRSNTEISNSKRVKRLRGRIEKNTQDAKLKNNVKSLDKKSQLAKVLFDEQGVITYGREKPLKCAISKSLMTFYKSRLPAKVESKQSSPYSSKIGMIINIGVLRPLYKEAYDNVHNFAFDDDGKITPAYAAFSSSAVQDSFEHPSTVKRILVPVVDDTLKNIMYVSKKSRQKRKGNCVISRCSSENKKTKLQFDLNSFIEPPLKMSEEIKQFVGDSEIDKDVCDIVNEMMNYVELKECFLNLDNSYDPDVPVPVEEEHLELSYLKKAGGKKKKTKLQKEIEILGGTFIAVQGEEGNEENLAQVPEEKTNCLKDSCKLGCVCHYRMLREEHCGKEACMFSCQCPLSARRKGCEIKSKIWLLPEVLRHHNVSQSKLAPVEREYHQTVIMSKDKKITIETKHRKRERKLPAKYKDEILFDYGKGNSQDDDNNVKVNDGFLVNIEDENLSKQNVQKLKESPDSCKKRQSSPMINSLQTTIKKPNLAHNYGLNIQQCYVAIEQNQVLNRMAAELVTTRGTNVGNKYSQSPRKRQRAKIRSRNVARKKTGGAKLQYFDTENFCSRTLGVTEDYVLRNFLGKLRTKDFMLYPSIYHGNKKTFNQPFYDSPTFKEDLVERSLDNETENKIEEKSPNEEELGLQIQFVHSIPPNLFEDQDKFEQEETINECNANIGENSSALPSLKPIGTKEASDNSEQVRQKRFVYAALPKTENECKWWVVELDQEKFTDLVHYSEKRSLSFSLIKKAIFDAEYNNATIKLVLKNSGSLFEDKFGAYVVGGHKHLIFFGPYELSETHGITAIRHEDEKFIQVPFTSKISKNENFKSLGINMSSTKENCQSVLKAVNAVWWYSTGQRESLKNVTKGRGAQVKSNSSIFDVSQNHSSKSHEREINHSSEFQESENASNEIVAVIEDDITIEQDPVKIEPFDFYEDNISNGSIEDNSTDLHISNSTSSHIDDHINEPPQNIEYLEENESKGNVESVPDLDTDTTMLVEDPLKSTTIPVMNGRSILKENVAKMKTSPVNKASTAPMKIDPIILRRRQKPNNLLPALETLPENKSSSTQVKRDQVILRRKKRKTLGIKPKRYRKEVPKKEEDMRLINLRKKIEDLKVAILSGKLERRENTQSSENLSEEDFESDSSSLSDVDLYKEISPEKMNDVAVSTKNVKREVHKAPKILPKSKESAPSVLPQNLLQKKPIEGPCPEKALLSLTPGIGYIPVVEFDPRDGHLVIPDPCDPWKEHLFQNKSLAVDWLNQYFLNRFIFKPKFDMQWVIMTGSIVRMLQPLNKDIFKYRARSLTIRPCGLELGHSRLDQDFADWERRELSLLKKKIANNSINNSKIIEQQEQNTRDTDPDYKSGRYKLPTGMIDRECHNDKERMRRSELAELMTILGNIVLPNNRNSKLAKIGILNRAIFTIEAQKVIEEELRQETVMVKRNQIMHNQKMRTIFEGITDPEEKRRARKMVEHITIDQFKLKDRTDKYHKAMIKREYEVIDLIRLNYKNFRPGSTCSMKSSSSNGSLGSLGTNSSDTKQTPQPATDTPDSGRKVGDGKQPTEGVLVKSNLRALTATRPDLKIYSKTTGGEVINLADDSGEDVDSSGFYHAGMGELDQNRAHRSTVSAIHESPHYNEKQVIEIESEEEDVIWLPAKEQPQKDDDDDVEFVSSSFKTKRPKLKFPKPKRKLPEFSPHHTLVNMSSNRAAEPAPVAMVVSPALLEQHRLAAATATAAAAPEFVAVDDNDYEPLFCEFKSGCSRTDPVYKKYQLKHKVAPSSRQFIPIEQTSIVKTVQTLTPNIVTPTVQRKVMTPFAHVKQIKLNNITSIGHIQNDKLCKFKGRPVLLRKSNEGIQISKLPTIATPPPQLTPLSAMPVTITETLGKASDPETVSPDRANTVTLYHPSEEISVTKTVQFANLNSVQLDMPSSSMLSGPKIRKPNDGSQRNLKILLPKRS